jgi:erythromycin esterase-like protein
VGQLIREQRVNGDTVLVGFGSYEGTVIAGRSWGAPLQVMKMPPAKRGSIESILHEEGNFNRLLIFDRYNKKERFGKELPHRAIGVVYDPALEKYANYVPSILSSRYDAFIYIDQTQALHPLAGQVDPHKTPETYPFNY